MRGLPLGVLFFFVVVDVTGSIRKSGFFFTHLGDGTYFVAEVNLQLKE